MQTIPINRPINAWATALDPKYRYIFVKGGRSSSKSHEIAGYLVERSISENALQIACLREVQSSIDYSSKKLIDSKISLFGLDDFYKKTNKETRKLTDNGMFIYKGMSDITAENIKSLEGFKIAWFEEARTITENTLKTLTKTIRVDDSQLIFTWNSDQPDDPIEQFAKKLKDDPQTLFLHINYYDNAFLPQAMQEEIDRDKVFNPDDFDHIWLGDFNICSDIRVFKNWRVEECEPTFDDDLFYGCDWGFSQDPTTLLRCWVNEDKKEIYVDYQIDSIGIETDKLPYFFKGVPNSDKYTITADSARPETISYMNRHGYKILGAQKGKGSVEAGINWLKGYTIVIHPRCKLLEKELRLYAYAVDRVGNILPKVEDKNNHCIDALRYALEKIIKSKTAGGFIVI